MSSLEQLMHSPHCLAKSSLVHTVFKGTAGIYIAKRNNVRGLGGAYFREQRSWPSQYSNTSLAASGPSANSISGRRHLPEEPDEYDHQSLSKEEVERRIRKAANLMRAGDELAPFDRRTFNPALVLW